MLGTWKVCTWKDVHVPSSLTLVGLSLNEPHTRVTAVEFSVCLSVCRVRVDILFIYICSFVDICSQFHVNVYLVPTHTWPAEG